MKIFLIYSLGLVFYFSSSLSFAIYKNSFDIPSNTAEWVKVNWGNNGNHNFIGLQAKLKMQSIHTSRFSKTRTTEPTAASAAARSRRSTASSSKLVSLENW